jgi:hypothetical protein
VFLNKVLRGINCLCYSFNRLLDDTGGDALNALGYRLGLTANAPSSCWQYAAPG